MHEQPLRMLFDILPGARSFSLNLFGWYRDFPFTGFSFETSQHQNKSAGGSIFSQLKDNGGGNVILINQLTN